MRRCWGRWGRCRFPGYSPPPIAALRSAPPRFDAGLGGVPASSPSGCAVAVRGGAGGGGRGHNAALRARGPLEASFDFFSIFFYLPTALFVYFHYLHEVRTPPARLSAFPPPPAFPSQLRVHSSSAPYPLYPPLPPGVSPPALPHSPQRCAAFGTAARGCGAPRCPAGEIRRDAKRRSRSGGAERVQLCPPGPS